LNALLQSSSHADFMLDILSRQRRKPRLFHLNESQRLPVDIEKDWLFEQEPMLNMDGRGWGIVPSQIC
jgi:hypothetical protein